MSTQEEFAMMLHWLDIALNWPSRNQRSWCQLRPDEQAAYRREADRYVAKHALSAARGEAENG